MTEIIRQLQQEHEQLGRVLDLLAAEVAIFRSGEVPDYRLIQEIVDYCLDYPDACHHPKEDVVFAAVMNRAVTLPAAIADLDAAHRRLSTLTRRLHETVERVMRDETMSRDRFIGVVDSFIDGYRMHIRIEEESFFPEALRCLDAADWAAIRTRLDERRDPLSEAVGKCRFATLRAGILHTA